ncbi:MAG TPA: hypothetical protein DGD08_16375 [Gemmatimonas aurantiaca]|uniref:CAAX protease n=2 Tax=Gemmatimonas aurantiaca TaxID=173480 RepID=C1A689_GEMAT|nr:hypothetical protein [Gemmatimonas aurantiaca]BAH37749.1 hypothetical protein GAU_0707 [Gemmatimonas aurantiaca T-27]HCT58783.1 hypothetical protein [Gemmatimonas aurantiaca]
MSLTAAQSSYFGQLKALIEEPRLRPYLAKEKGDLGRALARYYWNIDLCKAVYPALQLLEVDLRTRIDRAVGPTVVVGPDPVDYRRVPSWLTRNPAIVVHRGGTATVDRALDKISSKNPKQTALRTHDDLVAATSFGLWVGMLETAYDAPGTDSVVLWPDLQLAVFPGAPDELMTSIRTTFNGLRQFRNRVFHHEPIWPKGDTSPAPKDQYASILRGLKWLGSSHAALVSRFYDPVAKLDTPEALEQAYVRLLSSIDTILEDAARRKAEKEAKKAERKAAKQPPSSAE